MKLNYFPIKIDFDTYQVNTAEYSEEKLTELREKHNTTHSFFRNGDLIFISNKDGEENAVPGNLAEVSTYGNGGVTSSLIKHVFFRTFKDRFPDYTPVDFYPFRFFSAKDKDDIIFDALPEKLRKRIAYKKLIEVQLRQTHINDQKQFGFIVNIRRDWIFDISCAELHAEGYDLIGLDVIHTEILPGLTNILAPNEEFIGEMKAVSGENATVLTNEGHKEYPLNELFLRKTKFNIGRYLSFAASQAKSDEILGIIETKRSEIYNTKNLYAELQGIAKHLFSHDGSPILFQNKDGFCFTVSAEPVEVGNSFELRTPTFIFDYAGTKTENRSPDIGLTNYGPYDSITFDTKTPNVLSICHRENRGSFTNFLSALKNGISSSNYFQKGLQKKYDLQDVYYNIEEIQTYDTDAYLNAIRSQDDVKPNLAIIEIPGNFKTLNDESNPYYKIKAKLLSLEIPVQFVTSHIMKNYNEYILNAIALQIYAKLGGTPWVLPSQRSVDREIIIGIGHSWVRENQYKGASQSRVVGITTFMSSDGQYLLGDKVKDVPFESYFEELLKSLKSSIQRLETEQGWAEGDTIRLIFHIFKPIKNTEFDVISQLIKDISKYKIKFAFVTISKSHPYLLFDPAERGILKYGQLKGEYIPRRASNVFLDAETCVVQMFGPNELKTSKHGMSTPIQIKIRTPQGNYDNNDLNDLLYYDLNYITQQIFSFTYLSWRSFLPGEQPATMLYSNLISKLLSKMKANVSGWDADNLNYGLKRKKWFL